MLKRCALLGVLGALALPSAAFAVPGPPAAPPGPPATPIGCGIAAIQTADTPAVLVVATHCGQPPA